MSLIIKKFIYSIFCNKVTGTIIYFLFRNRIPDLRWSRFRFTVPMTFVRRDIVASLFWGFYESAEIRLIQKYLRTDLCVIELGSSLGVVSSHIASRLRSATHLVCVEANPYLIDTISENINRHRYSNFAFEVLNNAVSYDGGEVMISVSSDNTETSISKSWKKGNVAVGSITFEDIVRRIANREYVLVCDIEGSELEILLREKEIFERCCQLFIELHQTTYENTVYSVEMVKEIIVNRHGFKLVEEHGPVVYFEKSGGFDEFC